MYKEGKGDYMIKSLSVILLVFYGLISHAQYIEIYKHGVLHRFVTGDRNVDLFLQNNFHKWEEDTFQAFELVKDKNTIAIDLGAWIGTTAIWLSKNFAHVVAVDADRVSLHYLAQNLKVSDCSNVSICERPVTHANQMVVFGSRSNELNASISYVKPAIDQKHDYTVQSITLDQLLQEYVYNNPELQDKTISFIKCDIEGGEEDIMEDLLTFAYQNKIKVHLSFHHIWWANKKIDDFKHLLKLFKSNCPQEDVCQYIHKNPFAALLLEPLSKSY